MKLTNEIVADRLERWNDFVEKGAGAFMFRVNFPLPESEAKLPPAPPLWPGMDRERIERRWAEYELMCRKAELVDDDRVRAPPEHRLLAAEARLEVHMPYESAGLAVEARRVAEPARRVDVPTDHGRHGARAAVAQAAGRGV